MGDTGPIQQAKLVLLGDMGAGKSSLVLRFVKGQFFDYQARPSLDLRTCRSTMLSGILSYCVGYIGHAVCLQGFCMPCGALANSHKRHYVTGRRPTNEYCTF